MCVSHSAWFIEFFWNWVNPGPISRHVPIRLNGFQLWEKSGAIRGTHAGGAESPRPQFWSTTGGYDALSVRGVLKLNFLQVLYFRGLPLQICVELPEIGLKDTSGKAGTAVDATVIASHHFSKASKKLLYIHVVYIQWCICGVFPWISLKSPAAVYFNFGANIHQECQEAEEFSFPNDKTLFILLCVSDAAKCFWKITD